jgi:hypothetical protein
MHPCRTIDQVYNIVLDVFSKCPEWEELPTGLGLKTSWCVMTVDNLHLLVCAYVWQFVAPIVADGASPLPADRTCLT